MKTLSSFRTRLLSSWRPALAALAVTCAAGSALAYTGVWSTAYVSEETAPATCADDTVMYAMGCSGSYCDNNRGTCRNVPRELQNHYWTAYKSEEEGSNLCIAGYYVTGFDCRGDFCDNKSLQCTRLEGAGHNQCQWVGPFSEEGAAGASCPVGKLAAGTFCSGHFCDNQYIWCCAP